MKIVIATFGSRGDIAPFVGLAVRLKAAGHDVVVAANDVSADEIRALGLEFRAIPGDIKSLMDSEHGRQWRESSGMRSWRSRMQLALTIQADVARGIVAAARDADILLAQHIVFAHAYLVAQAMGIPCAALDIFPNLPTAEFQPAYLGARSLGRWANRLLPRLGMRMWTPLDAGVRDFQRSLGLPVTGLQAVYRALFDDERLPVYNGFSSAIVPRPADWRPGAEIVGYWWSPRPAGWQPPARLVEFLAAGPPPVYIGFGSMSGDGERLSAVVSQAIRRAGVRAVVSEGWARLAVAGEDVLTIGDVPHDWLFPQMAAVVSHAGAGTTGAVLRAGVPVVPTPVLLDQPFWAGRLARLGVSPGYAPLRRVSADWLAAMIRRAVSEPMYRHRAQQVADRVRREDGAGRVAEALARMPRRVDR
jgi:UDP:flavonoid glycosyltransferase YjiC (YdhE family)